uniref:AmpG family muropeptide MFS transporter n=1 Tax=Thaumasiovibrio occultus TaxID=1891184 RepID=UPI000B357BC8|nr:MFS transporter [Thaumasiovibrio occultus]
MVYANRKVLIMLALGFSSGLPILLVFGTLSFWLAEAGVSKASIGYFSWVGLAYGFKWAWAPLVDRFAVPFFPKRFGRRRSWLITTQITIGLALATLGHLDPTLSLSNIALCAVVIAFASATQDIVIDAFRIELGEERLQAALAASYQTGYRIAMILAGAGALWIAAYAGSDDVYMIEGWRVAYTSMGLCMIVGIITTLVVKEPSVAGRVTAEEELALYRQYQAQGIRLPRIAAFLQNAIVRPFSDFFTTYGTPALAILLLIATYRISDVVMGVMANVFYESLSYSKTEIANISKVFGLIMTLLGAGLGGILVNKFGTIKILALGALLSAATNVLFVVLAKTGYDMNMLKLVISADNLSAGIATAAFITFMSSLTNKAFSATQYAAFSSMMLLLPKFIAGFSGQFVEHFGFEAFFYTSALIGMPVLFLVYLVAYLLKRYPPDTRHKL